MADKVYSLDSFQYPERPHIFNSERRTQEGFCACPFGGDLYDIYGFQKYTLNFTQTSEQNPSNATLFTYANGVSINLEYWWTAGGQDQYRVIYKDKDGDAIAMGRFNGFFDSTFTMQGGGNPEAPLYLYFNPEEITYPEFTAGEIADGFSACYLLCTFDDEYVLPKGQCGYDDLFPRASDVHSFRFDIAPALYNDFLHTLENGGDGTPIIGQLPSDDTSDPGGGDESNPDYNPLSDPVDFPGLPTGGSSLATGFIRAYEPTGTQLNNLASELWDENFFQQIQKIQNDPMEAIISLHSIPFSVGGSSAVCKIGNYTSQVSMPKVTAQYHKRNLGSLYIPEHWSSALDYSPYVTIDLFIPFLGIRSVQVDDIIGRTITLEYNCDVVTGACVIHLKSGNSVLYTWNTNIMAGHPISASSMSLLYQGIAGAVGSALSGMTAGVGGAVGGAIGGAINVALSKHSSVSRGGSIAGNSGVLGNFTPYIIIHRPIQSLASGFAHFKGYPSNITTSLGSVSGYTEVESVHLNGITCTDSEKAEIEALLYNGVIL